MRRRARSARCCFNSRSRVGSDALLDTPKIHEFMFQFALPRGERRLTAWLSASCARFQFALPRGERPSLSAPCSIGAGFNSRSRVGSDKNPQQATHRNLVSIRAPAWGATSVRRSSYLHLWFQFALPRGERQSNVKFWLVGNEFQFALPRGERPRELNQVQSILWFQFALPRGERRKGSNGTVSIVMFQFALPRGERPCAANRATSSSTFQFALPRGERPNDKTNSGDVNMVSIRAPAWGATHFCY